jgi:penicillin amidase
MKRLLSLSAVCLTLVPAGLSPLRAAETAGDLLARACAVLSQTEGEITVPGLKEPVEVLRDRWGVPHIYARNQDDLFFAQGFVVAQDRLFQIDLWRRVGLGETAEVLGRDALEGDRFARLLRYRGDPEAEWASYSPDARRIATAFTRGINAWIDHAGDRLPVEFQVLGTRPARWRPEDCLGRMSGVIMTRNFSSEVSRAELVAAVGAERARRLAPTDPPRPFAPAPGLDLAGLDRSVLAGYSRATGPLRFRLGADGSNNWVIDGSRSASGKPLLANDPHRAIALPSLRYLVHLHAPGWDVIGAGEPGIPGVAVGHNERIAWGFTIAGLDQADLYVEETRSDDPTQYRAGDRWEKMMVVREKIAVKGEKGPAELELRFTRHGPVLHQDEQRCRAYALKWVGSEPGTAGYLGSLAVDRAGNWQEFLHSLASWKTPGENMIYADVDGNIGWVAAGLMPVRKGWDGLLPVPGSAGAYEWQGFLPVKDLPQTFNPASHVIATANHNILPPGYRHEIGYEFSAPYRFQRIRQRLDGETKLDPGEFESIQHDNTSLPGVALARLARQLSTDDPALRPYLDLMARWDGVLSVDAQAGPLYAVWLDELLTEFYRPYVPKQLLGFVAGRGSLPVVLAVLENPERTWFGEHPAVERDRLLLQTLAAAVVKVKALLGDDPAGWSWGKLHVTVFRHPLSTLGPAYAKAFDLGPVPRAGDGSTPNAASYNAKFEQVGGASYRQVFDLADWDRAVATSTPGQSGQPGSPHYADLLPLWAEGKYFPLAFSRARVEEVTRQRLVLKPRRD